MCRLNRKGFTLVELMIVVAIIALLVAIAIPNLLRARLNANEAAAVGALASIRTAAESYRAAQNPPTYPDALSAAAGTLTTLMQAVPPYVSGFSDPPPGGPCVSAICHKAGYTFSITPDVVAPGPGFMFVAAAEPITANVTGIRAFCADETGVIHTCPVGTFGGAVPPVPTGANECVAVHACTAMHLATARPCVRACDWVAVRGGRLVDSILEDSSPLC